MYLLGTKTKHVLKSCMTARTYVEKGPPYPVPLEFVIELSHVGYVYPGTLVYVQQ
jgi:hypothetical protein